MNKSRTGEESSSSGSQCWFGVPVGQLFPRLLVLQCLPKPQGQLFPRLLVLQCLPQPHIRAKTILSQAVFFQPLRQCRHLERSRV